MDTKFNVNDLIQEGLVKKKAYTEGKYTRAIEWAGNYDGVHAIYRAAFL